MLAVSAKVDGQWIELNYNKNNKATPFFTHQVSKRMNRFWGHYQSNIEDAVSDFNRRVASLHKHNIISVKEDVLYSTRGAVSTAYNWKQLVENQAIKEGD